MNFGTKVILNILAFFLTAVVIVSVGVIIFNEIL